MLLMCCLRVSSLRRLQAVPHLIAFSAASARQPQKDGRTIDSVPEVCKSDLQSLLPLVA